MLRSGAQKCMDGPVHCFGSWVPPPLRPPRVHLTSFTWWMLPGLPRFKFHWSSDSMYYCERKREIKPGEAWDRGYCSMPLSEVCCVKGIEKILFDSPCLERHFLTEVPQTPTAWETLYSSFSCFFGWPSWKLWCWSLCCNLQNCRLAHLFIHVHTNMHVQDSWSMPLNNS